MAKETSPKTRFKPINFKDPLLNIYSVGIATTQKIEVFVVKAHGFEHTDRGVNFYQTKRGEKKHIAFFLVPLWIILTDEKEILSGELFKNLEDRSEDC